MRLIYVFPLHGAFLANVAHILRATMTLRDVGNYKSDHNLCSVLRPAYLRFDIMALAPNVNIRIDQRSFLITCTTSAQSKHSVPEATITGTRS